MIPAKLLNFTDELPFSYISAPPARCWSVSSLAMTFLSLLECCSTIFDTADEIFAQFSDIVSNYSAPNLQSVP